MVTTNANDYDPGTHRIHRSVPLGQLRALELWWRYPFEQTRRQRPPWGVS